MFKGVFKKILVVFFAPGYMLRPVNRTFVLVNAVAAHHILAMLGKFLYVNFTLQHLTVVLHIPFATAQIALQVHGL